jgi:hypothetical protein
MKRIHCMTCLSIILVASALAAEMKLSPADEAAAFKAAGFTQKGKQWRACDDPSGGASPGAIEEVRDLNGDGRPEAVITEGGSFCYGGAGAGFMLVSKQENGSWKLITSGSGMAGFLKTKGVAGWPDLEIGGPGFCFPVQRWNGKEYLPNRFEYEGKACKPN